jgi:hypothetical protein
MPGAIQRSQAGFVNAAAGHASGTVFAPASMPFIGQVTHYSGN